MNRLLLTLIFCLINCSWVFGQVQYEMKIKMQIRDPKDNHSSRCNNDFKVTLNYSNAASETVVSFDLNSYLSKNFVTLPEQTIRFSGSKNLTSMTIYGKREWRNAFSCNGNDGNKQIPIPSTYTSCYYRKFVASDGFVPQWESIVEVFIYPVASISQVYNTENPDNFLPSDHKVTLNATSGFPNYAYHWQYGTMETWGWPLPIEGIIWRDFPSGLNYTPSTSFTGKDLFGADFQNMVGRNIYFRVKYACADIGTNTVTMNARLSAPNITKVEPIPNRCFGEKNGSLKIFFDRALLNGEALNLSLTGPQSESAENITALAPDNSYTWPEILGPGEYDISMIAGYAGIPSYTGGTGNFAIASFSSPTKVTFAPIAAKQVSCFGGSDGQISITAGGGVGSYKAMVRKANETVRDWTSFSNATSHTFNSLPAGQYFIRVQDGNDCEIEEKEVILTQPATPLKIDNSTITAPLAFGYRDGSIRVVIVGGTPLAGGAYTVEWSDASGKILTDVNNSTASGAFATTLQQLTAGRYTLKVRDRNYSAEAGIGCELVQTFEVEQPPKLEVTIAQTGFILCQGAATGSLKATATGGVPLTAIGDGAYTYEWFQQQNGSWKVMSDESAPETGGLAAGSYKVRVTDKNNISAESAPFALSEPAALSFTATARDVFCHGGADGQISIRAAGGQGGYQLGFMAAGDADFTWTAFSGANTHTLTGLVAGSYFVKVRDKNECIVTDAGGLEAEELVTVSQPKSPLSMAQFRINPPRAFGAADGSIQVSVAGGTPKADGSYTIVWRNSVNSQLSTYTTTMTNGGFETTLQQVSKGTYTLQVYDNNYQAAVAGNNTGCFVVQEFEVTEPPKLEVTVKQLELIRCYGDATASLEAEASGGVPFEGELYLYQWFKIENNVRQAITQTGKTASELSAGTYLVRVTDQYGVSQDSEPFVIAQPAAVTFQAAARAVWCFGGSDGQISISATGGSGNYELGFRSAASSDYTWIPFQAATSHTVQQLSAGTYYLKLRDKNSCYAKDGAAEKELKVEVNQPLAPLQISSSEVKAPLIFGGSDGSITATITGGSPDAAGEYQVVWLDEQQNPLDNYNTSVEGGTFRTTLVNLPEGTYTLQVYDRNFKQTAGENTLGCYVTQTFDVTQPPLLTVVVEQVAFILCHGEQTGELVATAEGGIPFDAPPYRYNWFRLESGNRVATGKTGYMASGLGAGTYQVQVTDRNGATQYSEPVIISEPDLLTLTLSATPVTCDSGTNGTVTSQVAGGTGPYTYTWSNEATTAKQENLSAGKYFVFVQDANGCEVAGQVEILHPSNIQVEAAVTAPVCYQDCNGAISLRVTGGVAPYTYTWNTGATTSAISGLCSGAYTVTITDAEGCISVQQYTLQEPAPLTVNLGSDRVLCQGQSVELNATIARAGATYQWSSDNGFTASTAAVTLTQAGTYWVTVTDSKGCVGRDEVKVTVSAAVVSADFVVSTQAFVGDEVVAVNISDPAPERIEWLPPTASQAEVIAQDQQELKLKFSQAGEYTIGMKAMMGGCEQVLTKKIMILERQGFDNLGATQEPFIKEFTVLPNPSTGNFTARIKLLEKTAVRLRFFNMQHNSLVDDRHQSGSDSYEIRYELAGKLAAGQYFLVLETAKGSRILKIIII